MSSLTIMDSFDAPMLDYSGDMDVHMHTTVSSPKPWTQAETIMEEDLHPLDLPNPFPSHHAQQDVEIDMDDYYNENVEYEMADGEIAVPDTELVDIDVYDAPREDAFSASAPISHSTGLTNQNIDRKPAVDRYPPSDIGVVTEHISADPDPDPLLRKSAELDLLTPTIPQETVVQDHDVKSSQTSASISPRKIPPPLEAVSEDPRSRGDASAAPEGHTDPPPVIAITDSTSNDLDTFQPLDDSDQQERPELLTAEHESSTPVPQIVTPRAMAEESPHEAVIRDGESHEGERDNDEGYEGGVPGPTPEIIDAGEPASPVAGSHEAKEEDNGDPHEISEGVYIEPPPPVLIELPSSSSDQLVCTLFNAPANLPSDDKETNASSIGTSYIVLLQNRPTLYYETLNDVFDALREEERIQSMTDFVEGEMVIDAYDLHLVVSEDNVHAREISLHDLNILHHGLGLVGPLRLRIRTMFSRFIYRYRSLQDQIKRLNVSSTTRHPVEDGDEPEYEGPSSERDSHQALNDDGQMKREPTVDGGHEGLTEGDVDDPEDVESTDFDHAEYQDEHEEEAFDESEQYADAQEYPQTHKDEAGTHEETDQYVANDEPEFVPDAGDSHEGVDPESAEYQERDEEYEDGISGDVEATSPITASVHTTESVLPAAESEVLTEVRESGTTSEYPQPEDLEERQDLNTELSSPDSVHEDEQTEVDGCTEDAEAEDDTTGDESAQPTDLENNLADVANEEDQGATDHDNTEYDAQEPELVTPSISLRGEYSESVNPHHHTEENEENAENWELDDGYADWEETIDGDELDIALVGEPDSVSSGSSTLSGKTASITSKRSFDEVDPTVGQSSLQSPKKTRTR